MGGRSNIEIKTKYYEHQIFAALSQVSSRATVASIEFIRYCGQVRSLDARVSRVRFGGLGLIPSIGHLEKYDQPLR